MTVPCPNATFYIEPNFHRNYFNYFRYLIFEVELEGTGQSEIGFLSIKYEEDSRNSGTPPPYVLESILSTDMCLNYSVDSSSKCFLVRQDDILDWKNKNLLSK